MEQDGDGSTLVLGPAEPGDEAVSFSSFYECRYSINVRDKGHNVRLSVNWLENSAFFVWFGRESCVGAI